jgi:NTE family protein
MKETETVALVFSGGFGLGAYHSGAYEAFRASSQQLDWVAGSSVGAITAALIAGTPPDETLRTLRKYWKTFGEFGPVIPGPARHAFRWIGAINSRLFGSTGHFNPRLGQLNPFGFKSLYDLGPTRDRLRELIDFARLNAGDMRVTIGATDLKTGDPTLFDSRTQAIELDHILASCGFLPEFAPVSIRGRSFGDGGLSWNAPFDPLLAAADKPLRLYIIDLYARDGNVPNGLEAALERKNDLLFGNQTFERLKYAVENRTLRFRLQGDPEIKDKIYLLSYRPGPEEAGPEKSFDFSRAAIIQRWRAGFLDMQDADRAHDLVNGIHRVRRSVESLAAAS